MPNGGTVSFIHLHHCVVNDNNKLLISSFLPTLMVFFFVNSIKGKSKGSGGSLKLHSLPHLAEERCLLVSESASYP